MQDSETDTILAPYLSRKELCEQLGKQNQTLIDWEKAGRGPPVTRIGRTVFYSRSGVSQWLRSLESNSSEAE